jgi:hypothetical protein
MMNVFSIQDTIVDTLNDGIVNAKAAVRSASNIVNDNIELLKDKTGN